MTTGEKQKFMKILEEKKALSPCPRCGNREFTFTDSFFNFPASGELKNIVPDDLCFPCVGVVCTTCGFVSFHALGILGDLE